MPKITEFGSLAWSIYPCFQITLIDIHKKLIIYYKSEFIFFLTTFRFWKSICIFLLRLKKSCQNSWWPDLCRRRAGSPWKSSQVETTITGAVPDTCGSSVWTLRVGDSKISTWRKASELDQQLIIASPPPAHQKLPGALRTTRQSHASETGAGMLVGQVTLAW